MTMTFRKATKEQAKLRMALVGVSGAGKTYSALNIAQHLGSSIAVIDTEHGSASKYAGLFPFDVLELDTFNPRTYIEAMDAAAQAGYDVLIIDSLSHAWMGKDGVLEFKDKVAARNNNDGFGAWRKATPLHNELVEAMLTAPMHLIVTMRSKMEYVVEKGEDGKSRPRKVGMQPVQREGLEYEFDVVCDMDQDNNLIVSKTRCPDLAGQVISKPGREVAATLAAWLSDGRPVEQSQPVTNGKFNRSGSIARIREYWQQEHALGGFVPPDELALDLEGMSDADLIGLGRFVKLRLDDAKQRAEKGG